MSIETAPFVITRAVAAPREYTVNAERLLDAPRERVFAAWTRDRLRECSRAITLGTYMEKGNA